MSAALNATGVRDAAVTVAVIAAATGVMAPDTGLAVAMLLDAAMVLVMVLVMDSVAVANLGVATNLYIPVLRMEMLIRPYKVSDNQLVRYLYHYD